MRPTKQLGDASRPPSADPGTSLLLIVAILAPLVAVAHPVATVALAVGVASTAVVKGAVRLSPNGRLCVPRLDRCVRLTPS